MASGWDGGAGPDAGDPELPAPVVEAALTTNLPPNGEPGSPGSRAGSATAETADPRVRVGPRRRGDT